MKTGDILFLLSHPAQLRSIIQWKLWHDPVHKREPEKESETLKRCYFFLEMTSRSFASVIQELHPELLVPVALFYLSLRALDTIEDDMTIDIKTKEPMLRSFDQNLEKKGWNFDGNGPNEKDRQLLVEFNVFVDEFVLIKPAYKEIIKDITKKMGNGMADYAVNAKFNEDGVNTIAEYDLYCHYVAGLVGEGLTRLFVEAKLANPVLLERPELFESMGLFLQKTNIIRDVKEDYDDGRRFYPKEVWSKHSKEWPDLFARNNRNAALNVTSELVLDALRHVEDCVYYLAGLREQSVFNFCAIPQTMAAATLEKVYRNEKVWEKNVKITKGDACQIMIESTQNLQLACGVFRKYVRKIQRKNDPRDPNFVKIAVRCGKIEQFIQSIFPASDPKQQSGQVAEAQHVKTEKEKQEEAEARQDTIYMMLAVVGILLLITAAMTFAAWMAGARFDLVADQVLKGLQWKADSGSAQEIKARYDEIRDEL